MKEPKIVILGGGPGAIFSAFGALAAGYLWEEVQIWGKGPTYPPGAFWLHEVPLNMFPAGRVRMQLIGSVEYYSKSQWGELYPTSAEKYAAGFLDIAAYNPSEVLGKMWGMLNTHQVGNLTSEDIVEIADRYEFVVQTFPTDPLVKEASSKYKFPVFWTEPKYLNRDNRCIHNGLEDIPWIRCTVAFGKISVEYPSSWSKENVLFREEMHWNCKGQVAMVPDLHPTQQPITDTLVGNKKNIFLTGRWTTLNRKALSHHSYHEVKKILELKCQI